MTGITIPLWVGVLGMVATIAAAVIAGLYTLKTKRVEVSGTGANAAMVELLQNAPALLSKAQELLNETERLKDEKRQRDIQIEALTVRVGGLETQIEALTLRCDALAQQAERLPGLEAEIADLHRQLAVKDVELERTRIERDAAMMAQERAEGALRQAQRTITEKVMCAESASPAS